MRVGREERALPRSKLEGIRKYVPRGYVFKICTKERGRRREVFDTIFEPILDCFADAIKLFATMKSRPPTRMKFTRRGSWRGAEWEKLDIQKVSRKVNLISVRRAIIGQQFFFSSRISFSSSLPLSLAFQPPVFATGEQLGQKLRKLVKGRICWKSGYCEWQLAVHYSWITATPGRRTGREEGRQRERVEEKEWKSVYGRGGKKRAKETRWMEVERVRELPSENIENRAYHSAK